MSWEPANKTVKFLITLLFFAAAFAYIEADVVVYLRAIFYKDGFVFQITNFKNDPVFAKYLTFEIGRETATLVLIFTSCILIEKNFRRRLAVFLLIFAIWDIFYYIWLKVLIDWPISLMDWDILFLIPSVWAGPVLAPLISSLTMLLIAFIALSEIDITVTRPKALAFALAVAMIIVGFCKAGMHIDRHNYNNYFSWPLFVIWHVFIVSNVYCCINKPLKGYGRK